jgi:dienelactone hydrolase
MMIRALALAVTAALLISPAPAGEAPLATKDLPVRIELHPFQTLTLSDQQFLTGDKAGAKPTTLGGELNIAQGQGRRPVVILMHGSGGAGGNIGYWQRQLQAMGISTFVIDGMTGRGFTGVGANQASLGRLNFILDIYRALDILAKHPRVDPSRIALMGFSRGGQAALYASEARFHKLWNESGAELAAYVAFYPDCATTYRDDTAVVAKPIRIFHGTPDSYNPVRTCKAFVGRLKEAKADVELTEYPKAEHGFDNSLAANPAVPAASDQSVRECTIREGENGTLINEATKVPFTYKDECVRLGPLVGHDPEATEAATAAVTGFLKAVLKP